ncbi:helix-turn-helix domain-containing protein [Sulfolobus acidocaldarius]|uniref:Conserved Archaeal HTH DNA binding domain protein n=4 Tax=Sulfolobus acidocaldarius TaxID=2285 RepID=Q4J6X4_SULAC|nr:helix-turn-helix domain-containing protein [Sulfolobus acidocaldarius]AAY81457.1 conserved Archaeal HTH DNA binding domain protein [Sulfolobus acidocaldarius DSM 639]AGE72059.1 HTH DNA binding domain-containing protein [Sulfolobus acidocaldarius N8]AGE74376.1 HTH DNA binding domain-containing protein [Sulfolobus acidocaldarius Ron12/I]ALU29754.1 RNA polymerase subunit sigma-70 [Sulfolobus acidocaldarius]ALU32491.1 RNA polymerase subunit sigma-70 [Sulfolobus acidocaldarius]
MGAGDVKKPINVTLILQNHPCLVMKLFEEMNVKAEINNVKMRESVTDHIATLKLTEKLLKELKERRSKTLRISENSVWIRTEGCQVCKILYVSDAVVEKVKVVGSDAVMYKLIVPNLLSLKSLIDELNKIGVKAMVGSISELDEEQLTERQLEILKLSYKMGFFDVDRRITMTELAEKLGIKAPTLEEILRRALRKAVKYYLDKKG